MHASGINNGLLQLEEQQNLWATINLAEFRGVMQIAKDKSDWQPKDGDWQGEFDAIVPPRIKRLSTDLAKMANDRGVRFTTNKDNGVITLDKSGMPKPPKGQRFRS